MGSIRDDLNDLGTSLSEMVSGRIDQGLLDHIRHLESVVANGDAAALCILGQAAQYCAVELQDTDCYHKAAAYFEEAAQQNETQAKFLLGLLFAGPDQSAPLDKPALAEKWLKEAAAEGHGDALALIALAHRKGSFVAKDRQRANALMRRAALMGSHIAQQEVGKSYIRRFRISKANVWLYLSGLHQQASEKDREFSEKLGKDPAIKSKAESIVNVISTVQTAYEEGRIADASASVDEGIARFF